MTPFPDAMPKKENIRQMFDGIAPSYDALNHVMSLGVDRRWRRKAVRRIVDGTPQRVLDVACGTGDSTLAIAKAAASGSRVVGTDISEGMMAHIRDKAGKAGLEDRIELQVADGEDLPFGEGSFDRVSCFFGIRNFEHRDRGLAEFRRVLRDGGKAVILELSVPRNRFIRGCYDLYFLHVMPRIGGLVSGNRAAYRYLPASVHRFPAPEDFCEELRAAGFSSVRCRTLSLGLCRLFVAEK